MNRTIKAFFITLFLYLALLLIFTLDLKKEPKKLPPRSTLSLTNLRLIQPPKPPKPTPQKSIQKPAKKPIPKPPQKVRKPSKKPSKKPVKKPKKEVKKIKKRVKKVLKKPKKRYKARKKPIVAKKTKERNTTLPSLGQLFARPTPKKRSQNALAALPPDLRKLYKKDFSTFTQEQKKFIRDNLWRIAQITQKYLYLRGYPYVAIKTRQEGINAVEFILHPNGDITTLRLIGSSGYEALDKNSIETIKTAYKDYPRPKEPTKIRINVRYSIIY